MSRGEGVPSDQDIIHALADDLPVGIWVARAPNGEELYTNAMFAEIMGQGRRAAQVGGYAEPYGILTRDGRPYPEDQMPFVRALVERRVVVVDDIMIRRPDQTSVHVRVLSRPVMNAAGVITHVVCAFFDITKQVEAEVARAESEARLRRAQRLEAVGTLAGGIAHDFNNLIFGIKLLAAELAATETDADKLATFKMIDDVTERSAVLTRSLLGFARRGKHRAMPVPLDEVVGAMRDLLTRTFTGIAFDFELEPGAVLGDASQLEQVVMNLVVNARDAVMEKGQGRRVVVRTRSVGPRVVLEVADDGPGISPEIRDRVFEPYFTTKTHGANRGAGLGLATVFGIVESHGGVIEIDKGLRGVGATLRVTFPVAVKRAVTAPTLPDGAIEPGSGTILVVDDDPIICSAVARTLRGLGYLTYEAGSGMEAVALFREHRATIRAVVLDMIMPGMSGGATFAAMRELDQQVTVLLMSGYAMNEDVQVLLDAGARGFVTKPYSSDTLARALAAAIASAES